MRTDAEPTPRDAATVIVARDGDRGLEVYMLRRSAGAKAFPGAYVFPGGTVDAADAAPEARARLAGRYRPEAPAFTHAAIRETFEECGLLFADAPVDAARLRAARLALLAGRTSFGQAVDDLGVRLDASALHYYARRITPPAAPYRFDVRFFVARLPEGQVAEADAGETHDGEWVLPAAMAAAAERDGVRIPRPTLRHLERLATFPDVAALLLFAANQHPIPGDD